ncbi:MAG: hypothetical protein H7Y02_10240 [Candidatus Obscuribacterales bacterium]|nr:hypothetical protein [Steroidobacteraceae bacterium]
MRASAGIRLNSAARLRQWIKALSFLKLRTHINLIVGCLSAVFIALVVSARLDSTRRAISEEIVAANVVAVQLLGHVVDSSERAGPEPLLRFLESLGRVRANEISLYAANGAVLYRSPDSTYKAGREAPQWFTGLLMPTTPTREFVMPDGLRLVVKADASRAILDGWDDVAILLKMGAVALGILNLLVFWLVRRALSPLPIIADGLSRLRHGELKFRLPRLQGFEASAIGNAFNDMALAVEEKVQAERQARDAEARLDERRELAQLIEQRIEEERRMIARELHDEFGQSVTAIRSLALSIAARMPSAESPTGSSIVTSSIGDAATLISSEAARLYDAMHGLIPRLAPLTLDNLGLEATLRSFVDEWQQRNPSLELSLRQNLTTQLGPSVALAIYRVVQEALINALRHGQPAKIEVSVECDEQHAYVRVSDDGIGLREDWQRPGRFGLRGLKDRIDKLHGRLQVNNRATGGVEVCAEIPLQVAK